MLTHLPMFKSSNSQRRHPRKTPRHGRCPPPSPTWPRCGARCWPGTAHSGGSSRSWPRSSPASAGGNTELWLVTRPRYSALIGRRCGFSILSFYATEIFTASGSPFSASNTSWITSLTKIVCSMASFYVLHRFNRWHGTVVLNCDHEIPCSGGCCSWRPPCWCSSPS